MSHMLYKNPVVVFNGHYEDGSITVIIEVKKIFRKSNAFAWCDGLDDNPLLLINTGQDVLYAKDFKTII